MRLELTTANRRWLRAAALFLVGMELFVFGPDVQAQTTPAIALHMAIPEPAGFGWSTTSARILGAWRTTLRRESGGAIRLVLDIPEPEAAVVGRLAAHQVDLAMLTGVGLTQVAPSTLMLQLPGVCPDHPTWDRVRGRLDASLRAGLGQRGLDVLSWTDRGEVRIFSVAPIRQPGALAGLSVWSHGPDPALEQFLYAAGAQSSPLAVDAVAQALASGALGAVAVSAEAVRGDWSHSLHYVTDAPGIVATGAILRDRGRLAALPRRSRSLFDSTAAQMSELLERDERRAEGQALEYLRTSGIQTIDPTAAAGAWAGTQSAGRAALVGPVITSQQLNDALAAAAP